MTDWRDDAACLNHPRPDLWHPHEGDKDAAAAAKLICGTCPVNGACLDHAMRHEQVRTRVLPDEGSTSTTLRPARWGIWGGLTADERHDLAAEAAKATRRARRRNPGIATEVHW